MVKKQKDVKTTVHEMDGVDSSSCRICQAISKEVLVSACNCKGSLRYVHRSCLQEWINATKRTSCELCCFKFKVIQTKRYKCCRSLFVWLMLPTVRTQLRTELVFVAFLTIVTGVIIFFCCYISFETKHGDTFGKVIIAIIIAIVLMWYFKEMFSLLKTNVHDWLLWWRSCIITKVVIEDRKINTAKSCINTVHEVPAPLSETLTQPSEIVQKTISTIQSCSLAGNHSDFETSDNPHEISDNVQCSMYRTNGNTLSDIEKRSKIIISSYSSHLQKVDNSLEPKPKNSCILERTKKYDQASCDDGQEVILCSVEIDSN